MTKLQPKLRFPEFTINWEEKKLKEIGRFIGGGTPSTKKLDFWKGNIPWISSSDLSDESIYKINISRYITNEAILQSATKLIPKNSILIVSRVGVGKVVINTIELCTSQDFTNLTPYYDNYLFIAYLIKVKTNKLLDFNQGTSIKGFVKSDLEDLLIAIPTLHEQTKIANFLTAIDERLQALHQKKSLLEQYKKGVMQQIFNQELRFKQEDGSDFPDWEEKKFDEIFEPIPSKKFQIQSNEIKDYGKYEVVDQGKKMIAGYSDKENSLFRNIPVILFGDHTTVLKYIDFEFIVGADGTKLLKNKSGNLKYLYYNLLFNNVEQEGYKRHFTILSEKYLQIPSPPEQQKIANFLTIIDEKINKVTQQIELTQTYKKGLLQQMFC
ncbi:restriction endonuclease subunit S [Emticicia sp. 17c]|uniref:restriction endonuclease subunit S n=1 Tax=Emticicia sp. 17c TaxID=3127704 RepID=UPI00301BD25D